MSIYNDYKKDPVLMVREMFKVEPDEWQKDALMAFASEDKDKQRIAMKACAGPGKLHSASSLIPTPSGIVKYGTLKAGDKVFAQDGSVSKIIATIKWDNIQMYRVKFSDGSWTDVGAQHMWKVQSRHFKKFKDWGLAETQELVDLEPVKIYPNKSPRGTDRKVRRFRIPIQGAAHFTQNDKDIDLPIDPYLLGLWLGDGCRKTGFIVKDDNEPFDCVKNELGYEVKKQKTYESCGQKYLITGLKEDLKEMGICSLYSGQRYIPDLYKYASSRQRRELLMGLMDTDGRIKTNGMMDYHSTSKKLIEDFVWLARSIGCYAHSGRKTDTHKETSDCFSASLRTDFNPFRIKRKADRWKKPPQHQMYRYIESIEKLGIESSHCIEIDHPSHCYLADDFIVTHNSAVLSWIAWNFLLCYNEPGYHPKGAAISMTHTNLMDNLWAEIYHWQTKNAFLMEKFKWTKTKVMAKDHPETWFISARSFSKAANKEEQGRALSGMHAKYVLFLLDEAGSIPNEVGKTAEQALSNCEFGKIAISGNPTSHDGFLYKASKDPDWFNISITGDPDDPKRSPRIDIDWAREMIAKEGRDDPWVQSMILGQFPDVAINTLLTDIDLDRAEARAYQKPEYEKFEKVLGVDCARFGSDSSVIYPRQGLVAFKPKEIRKADGPTLGNAVLGSMNKWKDVSRINIDGSGGYGGSCYDYLAGLNTQGIQEISFSQAAMERDRFYNRRAEMYWNAAQWIKKKGSLIANKKLREELTNTTYYFVGDRIKIESKDQIKLKLKRSPDFADAFALTFAFKDEVKNQNIMQDMNFYSDQSIVLNEEYDPLGRRGKSRN